jgi:hypothetical protein
VPRAGLAKLEGLAGVLGVTLGTAKKMVQGVRGRAVGEGEGL